MTGNAAGLFALIGAGVAFCIVTGTNPIAPLVDVVGRGQRLTFSTVVEGVVRESPAALAAQAAAVVGRPVSEEAIALALMVRAEGGSGGQTSKVYRCHVAYNQASGLGWSVVEVITYHTTPTRNRHFGEQITGRFASGRDCYEGDLQAAEFAAAQRAAGEDPTAGALNFVDRDSFGVQSGTGSFADVVDRWAADGKVPGTLPDAQSGLVFFWRGELPEIAEGIG
jgi:hypothetical protein